jgi:predicted nucleic acid-binding protein
MSRINKVVLADTGFWLGLCDGFDQHHEASARLFESVTRYTVVMAWPVLYEVLRTRLVRCVRGVERFERVLRDASIQRIDDGHYREHALQSTLQWATQGRRAISLVDMVLRLMIEDDLHFRVHALITFNGRDFADSCRRRGIAMVRDAEELASSGA